MSNDRVRDTGAILRSAVLLVLVATAGCSMLTKTPAELQPREYTNYTLDPECVDMNTSEGHHHSCTAYVTVYELPTNESHIEIRGIVSYNGASESRLIPESRDHGLTHFLSEVHEGNETYNLVYGDRVVITLHTERGSYVLEEHEFTCKDSVHDTEC